MATKEITLSTRIPDARKQKRDSYPLTFDEARWTPGIYEDDLGAIVMISQMWGGKVNVNMLGLRGSTKEVNMRRESPSGQRYRRLNINAKIVLEGLAE